jgi:glycosyltransferase involved in cell wall biosynthesis
VNPSSARPVVSIILPTFNRLEFLRPAIDSVFEQTFVDWQLIIADDGSDERTRAYLRTLASRPRVNVIWLPHTGNPSAVRNAALREAEGKYIAFLDSDDLWRRTKLERQIAALKSAAGCRWGYTAYDRIGENGESIYPDAKPMVPYRGAIFEQLLTLEAEVSTPAVIVERSLLAQVGGFDEELLLWEDYDLWLRLALHSDIDVIDEPLTRLRSHAQHYSGPGTRNQENRLRLLKKMHPLATDAHQRSVTDRLIARHTLNLARLYSNSDRLAAARTLMNDCPYSWRYKDWWAGLPWLLLKLLAPRALINFYRRARSASGEIASL